ncbi:hypothetical protein Tco_1182114 [Tanacetum coccineum]
MDKKSAKLAFFTTSSSFLHMKLKWIDAILVSIESLTGAFKAPEIDTWMDNRDNQRWDVFDASIISRRHRVLCDLGLTFHYFRKRSNKNRGSFVSTANFESYKMLTDLTQQRARAHERRTPGIERAQGAYMSPARERSLLGVDYLIYITHYTSALARGVSEIVRERLALGSVVWCGEQVLLDSAHRAVRSSKWRLFLVIFCDTDDTRDGEQSGDLTLLKVDSGGEFIGILLWMEFRVRCERLDGDMIWFSQLGREMRLQVIEGLEGLGKELMWEGLIWSGLLECGGKGERVEEEVGLMGIFEYVNKGYEGLIMMEIVEYGFIM